ncbi:unnamed protein product [Closterium sp. NIES-53]
MEVARTSMIHAAAPHFLWPFAVRYTAHQLNLWLCVSLRWTGEVCDASVFRVWGSGSFVRDTSADKLSPRAIPCVFLGFVRDAPGWQIYHPTSRRVFPSLDVTFDESVPIYRLFPYRSAPPPPPPLFLAPGPPPVDPLPPQGPAPSGVSQVDPLPGPAPVQVAVDSGAEHGGVEPGGAESEGAEIGGAEPGGIETGGAEPGVLSLRVLSLRVLSLGQLREWFVRRARLRGGATGAGGARASGARGAGVAAGAGVTGGTTTIGPGGARTRGTGAAGAGGVEGAGAGDPKESGATGADGSGVGGAGAVAPGGAVRPRPYIVPQLQQVLGTLSSTSLTPPLLCPPPNQSQPPLLLASSLPAPSPYTEQSGGLTEHRTHAMALRPSSVPLRVPPPAPPTSSLPEVPDPESDRAHAASPTVSRLLATAVTDPSFESAAASALVAELLDIAAAYRLDYAAALVAESASASSPSVAGESALGTNVLEDRQEDFQCLAATVPFFASMLLAPEGDPDAPDIPTPRSYAEAITGTYVNEVPPPGANIVDGMWIFRVKRPSGSPLAFKARYVARGFSQRQGVDYFQTFSPTLKMTTLQLFLRTDTSLPPFFVLFYVDDLVFATADTEALTLVKLELQKIHTCTDLGDLRSYLGLQITRDRAPRTITLTQSHMVHHVLQRFGFQFSSPQPTSLSTSHSLSAPPSDESVEPSGPYPELVGCLMYLMTCTRPDLAYPLSLLARYVAPGRHRKVHWDAAKRVLHYLCSTSGMGLVLGGRGPVILTSHADASWVDDSATQRSSLGYPFSLGFGSVAWRSTRSSSVLSSTCEAEIYAGAMAAQELRWHTYLLTDFGE